VVLLGKWRIGAFDIDDPRYSEIAILFSFVAPGNEMPVIGIEYQPYGFYCSVAYFLLIVLVIDMNNVA
jgi:hypothetical protein